MTEEKEKCRKISVHIITYILNNLGEIFHNKHDAINHVANILEVNFVNSTKQQAKKYKAFFDGSCIPNPGVMRIGGYIEKMRNDGSKEVVWTLSEQIGHGTNNIAEYRALIGILKRLIQIGALDVEIYGDSELIVKQIKGENKVNRKKFVHIGQLYDEVMELLEKIPQWQISHIKREKNKIADALTR